MRKEAIGARGLRNLWKNMEKTRNERVPDPINTRIFPAGARKRKIYLSAPYWKNSRQEIAELAQKEDLEEIKALLKKFYQEFLGLVGFYEYRTGEFREVFGDHPGREDYECVCPANVDLILQQHLYGREGKSDHRLWWMFDFPVPVNFIMWRLIHELYTHVSELPRLCHEDEMMAEFDISYTDYEIFMDLDHAFRL